MTDFNAKMHQIRFRLGLRPRPRWGRGELTALPRPLAGFGGSLRGRDGLGWGRGRKGGGEGEGGGSGGEGKGRPPSYC